MEKPLSLSKNEQMCFMRAVYSVFYRDKEINDIEKDVLRILNRCFELSEKDYEYYVHQNADDIAKEINKIKDIRVRIYFMRIIHDVYREEIKKWFKGRDTENAKKFRSIYWDLKNKIELK